MKLHDLYHKDFYAWTEQMTQALKKGALDEVDIEHLVEEVESMGASDLRELKSRLIILIAHLLKWAYQPDSRSSNWIGTISEQRTQLQNLLEQSPSLNNKAKDLINDPKCYAKSVKIAVLETGLDKSNFPTNCPYHLDQLLDDDFFPDSQ